MSEDILILTKQQVVSLYLDNDEKIYVLELAIEKSPIICSKCKRVIEGVLIFCNKLRVFYHKDCISDPIFEHYKEYQKKKPSIVEQFNKRENPFVEVHCDRPVKIIWKKNEPKTNKNRETGTVQKVQE